MAPDDPVALLRQWLADAEAAGLPAPNAMVLATADAGGAPHARTVLVTAVEGGALHFHSSAPTGKTRDLAANPRAAGVFGWPALGRQLVVTGPVAELDRAASEAAFPHRSPVLRRLAWAFDALAPAVEGPLEAVAPGAVERAFAEAPDTGAPPSWTTFALTVERVEAWEAGEPPSRTRYLRDGPGWRHAPVLP